MIHSTKWSSISEKLSGRNPYSVKNRFHSLLLKYEIDKNDSFLLNEVANLLRNFFKSKKQKFNAENQNKSNNYEEYVKMNSFTQPFNGKFLFFLVFKFILAMMTPNYQNCSYFSNQFYPMTFQNHYFPQIQQPQYNWNPNFNHNVQTNNLYNFGPKSTLNSEEVNKEVVSCLDGSEKNHSTSFSSIIDSVDKYFAF